MKLNRAYKENKVDTNKMMNYYFISNGMIHLAYTISSKEDLLNPYCIQDYEILNDAFLNYIEQMLPFIPKNLPIILEITGCEINEEDKHQIERALYTHFQLRMANKQKECHRCLIKIAWFLLSFILSSYLLFCTNDNTDNVIVQYAYLPFWFFGYRFLIYLILDYLPLVKERRQYAQLSSLQVFYTQKPADTISNQSANYFADQIANHLDIEKSKVHDYNFEKEFLKSRVNYNEIVNSYFMENNTLYLQCKGKDYYDFIRESSVKGYELPNDDLLSFIENTIPYIPKDCSIVLEIQCDSLNEKEKNTIKEAIHLHFSLSLMREQAETKKSLYHILNFIICLIGSSILLFLGANTNKALHEFITMMLWFFGDYLIEYILIGQKEAINKRNKQAQMCNMDIQFKE